MFRISYSLLAFSFKYSSCFFGFSAPSLPRPFTPPRPCRARSPWRGGVLHLDPPVLAVFLPEQIHFRARVGGPEVEFFRPFADASDGRFECKAFPRRAQLVVCRQIALTAQGEQGVQQKKGRLPRSKGLQICLFCPATNFE